MSYKWQVAWLLFYGMACAGAAWTFGPPADFLVLLWAFVFPTMWPGFQRWRAQRLLRKVLKELDA